MNDPQHVQGHMNRRERRAVNGTTQLTERYRRQIVLEGLERQRTEEARENYLRELNQSQKAQHQIGHLPPDPQQQMQHMSPEQLRQEEHRAMLENLQRAEARQREFMEHHHANQHELGLLEYQETFRREKILRQNAAEGPQYIYDPYSPFGRRLVQK